jgi:hypothetical protein
LDPHRRWLTLGFGTHGLDDRGMMTEARENGCHYGVAIVAAAVK